MRYPLLILPSQRRGGHVADAAGVQRQQAVFRGHHRLEGFPFGGVQFSVVVGVFEREKKAHGTLGQLRLLQGAIMVDIVFRQRIGERWYLYVLAWIVER